MPFLMFIIAVIGAWIAWQQWQIKQAEYEAALYDRRFKVFEEMNQLIVDTLDGKYRKAKDGKLGDRRFDAVIVQAEFLFEPEVAEYMRNVYQKCRLFSFVSSQVAVHTSQQNTDKYATTAASRQAEMFNELTAQLTDSKLIFKSYLKVTRKNVPFLESLEKAISRLP